MDPNLLQYYNRELQFIRDMGGEFAEANPKIAGRLGLNAIECADPYVERLLEGFAFLAARVQLKVDAEFPRFTQHLLEMVYPHFLAPLPSMTVVRMTPDFTEGSLKDGVSIPRDTQLRSMIGKGEQTACEYRTAHDVTLWPIRISEAEYLAGAGAATSRGAPKTPRLKAALRLRLEAMGGATFNELSLDRLPVFLVGEGIAVSLFEQLTANLMGAVAQPVRRPVPWREPIPTDAVRGMGFSDDEALLPYTARSFSGYRLLQEYFAMPERFLFVNIAKLAPAVRRCEDSNLDLLFLFDRNDPELTNAVQPSHFNLFCTPAINLFQRRADRIHLTHRTTEYHVVPDRNRPMDFEVYGVSDVTGFGDGSEPEVEFRPFYEIEDRRGKTGSQAYYTLYREPRRLSTNQRRKMPRSPYIGSEVFMSLVDAEEAPFGGRLKQIGMNVRCTNRDLPLHMPVGIGPTDFSLQTGAPVESVQCLVGPTPPRASSARREVSWQLISHLALNYLSLSDDEPEKNAAALRQILSLYGDRAGTDMQKQVEGVFSVQSRPVVRRIPRPGPIAFGRGLEVTVHFDESAYPGSGVILLGSVLEAFFARHVGVNSFTETVIQSIERGEIKRWPPRIGKRNAL